MMYLSKKFTYFSYLVVIGLIITNMRTIDEDIMDIGSPVKKSFVIKHQEVENEDKDWKGKILNTIKNHIEDDDDDYESSGVGPNYDVIKTGSGNTMDVDANDMNSEESGSGLSEDEDYFDREDSEYKSGVSPPPKSTPNTTIQKGPGAWTLSCPTPCSQTCSPSCTPQCCMDNFAMAPPVPENIKDMYLCPSFCTDTMCPSSCPSYCCALPAIAMGNLQSGESSQNQACQNYCAAYSPVDCPSTCGLSCCSGQYNPPPPISVTAQMGYAPDIANVINQADMDICASYCSTPQMCQTNMFCPPRCCK